MLKKPLSLPYQMHLNPQLPRIRTLQEEIYFCRSREDILRAILKRLILVDEFHLSIRKSPLR